MSDLLGISSSAVTTYQRALGVVSNNIANAATEGYTRQDVSLESSPAQNNGKVYLGTGVIFSAVKRQYDAFVEANLRNSNSDLQSQKPMVGYTNRVVDVMGGESSGLGSALDQFFSSARSLSADPASTVLRSSFLRDADGLAARFNQLSAQLDLVDNETREAVQSSVTQMNALGAQLASVNQQLSKHRELSRQPAELLDQRDQLLLQLSNFTKLNTQFAENGEATVSLGTSISRDVIVSGKTFTRLGVDLDAAAPERISIVLDPYGEPRPLAGVNSGELAGLMSFREQVLGSTRTALDNLAQVLAREVNAIHTQGVDMAGQRGGELFGFDSTQAHASAGLRVVFTDPLKVSAASAFRVIEDASNPGTEDATIVYAAPQYMGPAQLSDVLGNNGSVGAAQTLSVAAVPGAAALAAVPAGMKDVTLYLDSLSPGQQLQLLTRDGRHLAGQSLGADLQDRLLTSANGFETGAGYSTQYLNAETTGSYRDVNVFYGARAAAQAIQQFDSQGKAIAPQLQGAVLQGGSITTGWSGLSAGDHFKLNGKALGALSPANGSSIQASDVARWLNAAGATGITASASNEIRLPARQLQLQASLRLNGQDIAYPAGGYTSVQNLVDAINDQQGNTNVTAYLSPEGELVLNNSAGHEGEDIQIAGLSSSTPNALGLSGGTFGGQVRMARANGDDTAIELSISSQGDPATLAKLGLRTQVHIEGELPDDALVFVTGAGSAKVAASYSGQASDAIDRLRANPMTLVFTSSTRYQLSDQRTGTVLAERDFDPNNADATIAYQGMSIRFSKPPQAGDKFSIDGNRDGSGDNQTMLALVDLESRSVVGSKTLNAAYIDHVNDMGNVARQATIVQSSLKVVHDQAVSSRDQVSGVSLDEEATNLIRFQQAYQASAKALQVASQLFDTMLQIR